MSPILFRASPICAKSGLVDLSHERVGPSREQAQRSTSGINVFGSGTFCYGFGPGSSASTYVANSCVVPHNSWPNTLFGTCAICFARIHTPSTSPSRGGSYKVCRHRSAAAAVAAGFVFPSAAGAEDKEAPSVY